jgi:hypothetical protein
MISECPLRVSDSEQGFRWSHLDVSTIRGECDGGRREIAVGPQPIQFLAVA